MKKLILIFLSFVSVHTTTLAQFYGQLVADLTPGLPYQFGSSQVTNIHSNGFITANFTSSNIFSKNLWINKRDINMNFSGANDFMVYYKIYKDLSCNTMSTQTTDTYGVSIIETGVASTPTNGARYALTTVVDGSSSGAGCVFATLDQAGMVVSSAFYDFPTTASQFKKSMICESTINPGYYYIAGSYQDVVNFNPITLMYVIYLDVNGNIQWSNTYTSGFILEPRAMLESPHNNTELILVGRNDPDPNAIPFPGNRANDGFFMKLSASSGTVQLFKVYGHTTTNTYTKCNDFNSISSAFSTSGNSNGFVIGGNTESTFGGFGYGPAWILKIDQSGNILWNTVIEESSGQGSGGITGVVERFSSVYGYEYYGVQHNLLTSTNPPSTTVFKLDATGNLVNYSSNEFNYLTDGSWNPSITYINSGTLDDGIQVYSTHTQGTSGGGEYIIKGYYDGNSGCNENLTLINTQESGPSSLITPPVLVGSGLTQYTCPSFEIQATNHASGIQSFNCSATSIVGAGNQRLTSINEYLANEWTVGPNPSTDVIRIIPNHLTKASINISLFSMVGKRIFTESYSSIEGSLNLNGRDLGLAPGIYTIRIEEGNAIFNFKILLN